MPGFYEVEAQFRIGTFAQRVAIKPHAGAGILRSQANDHGVVDFVGDHPLQSLRDEGPPVSHPDIHRQLQPGRQEFALLQSDFR